MNHDDIDLSGSKILIIDDTPANMDIIRNILEQQGYRVFAAPSGEIGLKLANRIAPDLILLDVMMPGINGWETCSRLKANPQTKNIPVIFVSAKTCIADIAEGFKVGGVDYINKPIRQEELLARVYTHLEIVCLFDAQEKLSKELADKNAALIETQQQLVHAEKMISLGTLTAGLAHEINNPNNFIHVSAQNLDNDIEQLKSLIFALVDESTDQSIISSFRRHFAPLTQHVLTIMEGSERITNIVKDLKAFSQHDSLGTKIANIGHCLLSTINLVRTKYAKITDFKTNIEHEINLSCHPAQLNQVFINLIVNACDAIKCSQEHNLLHHGQIQVNANVKNKMVIIEVKDNGCGMNEAVKSQIFEPFFTTKRVGDGSGLGLSVAYGIARNHGGEITVLTEPNQGSTFTLSLPLSQDFH